MRLASRETHLIVMWNTFSMGDIYLKPMLGNILMGVNSCCLRWVPFLFVYVLVFMWGTILVGGTHLIFNWVTFLICGTYCTAQKSQ